MGNRRIDEPSQGPFESQRIAELEDEICRLRRLQATMERNARLFEALLRSSKEAIALTRLDGTLIRVVHSVLGYASNDVAGAPIAELVHPDDRFVLADAYHQLEAGLARQVEYEYRMRTVSGSYQWMRGTLTDMLNDDAVHAVVHNCRDATQSKFSELVVAELAVALAHAPFACFSKAPEGEILTWNRGAQLLFGYEEEEIVGQNISLLVPPEIREEEQRLRAALLVDPRTTERIPTVRLHKDGTLVQIRLLLSPVVRAGCVTSIVHLSFPDASAPDLPANKTPAL